MKLLLEVTHVRLSFQRCDYTLYEYLCLNASACIAFQSCLPPLIIFPLFHFLPTLKEKHVSKDKDDKMRYKQREMHMCVKNETQKYSPIPTPPNKTTALTNTF